MIVRFIMTSLLLIASPLMALYNGNPSLPDMPERGLWAAPNEWWGLKAGYEADWTFSKEVKVKDRVSSVKDLFDEWTAFKQFGVLTFNVIDRFEIYAFLGTMQLTVSQRPVSGTRIEYESNQELTWGIGGRVILLYWAEVLMGVNALYTGSHVGFDRVIQNGVSRKAGNCNLDYDEWQVGMSFSREIGVFIPYIGLAYASMRSCLKAPPRSADFAFNPQSEELQNRRPFILLLGFGMTSGRIVNCNLESRLIGERSLTLSADLRF